MNLILRWSVGIQETTTLSDYRTEKKYQDFLWLSKVSILSFQKWFPQARFVVLYNGPELSQFKDLFFSIDPQLTLDIEIIDQKEEVKKGALSNPYHFFPFGVWWKWIPWRIDIDAHEIAIDTDIICLNKPTSWYDWIEGKTQLLVAPDRFETVRKGTCGDFFEHPVIRGKKPANCGIVGQRAGYEYGERFFEITKEVQFGYTHDSMFITEQGAINLWLYSLELEGVTHTILDFSKNAWMRDFLYFLRQGIEVETLHAVSWHKQIARELGEFLMRKITDSTYTSEMLVLDILKQASQMGRLGQYLIDQQIKPEFMGVELYLGS